MDKETEDAEDGERRGAEKKKSARGLSRRDKMGIDSQLGEGER